MKTTLAFAAIAALTALPSFAQDVAEGESAFRQCQTCHVVVNEAGETLAGRNAQTGPNLYNVAGRTAGSQEEFDKYSDSMVEAGEAGLAWNEEDFVAYVQDPTGYLREYLDDNRARGAMSYKVRKEEDAANLWAYLVSLGTSEATAATN